MSDSKKSKHSAEDLLRHGYTANLSLKDICENSGLRLSTIYRLAKHNPDLKTKIQATQTPEPSESEPGISKFTSLPPKGNTTKSRRITPDSPKPNIEVGGDDKTILDPQSTLESAEDLLEDFKAGQITALQFNQEMDRRGERIHQNTLPEDYESAANLSQKTWEDSTIKLSDVVEGLGQGLVWAFNFAFFGGILLLIWSGVAFLCACGVLIIVGWCYSTPRAAEDRRQSEARKLEVAAEKAAKEAEAAKLRQTPDPDWQQTLYRKLLALDPFAFERLCADFLRGNGFERVSTTPSGSDRGIDGFGYRDSLTMAYQSKRYAGSVGRPDIQKFLGATQDYDERYFITTGRFSGPAKDEARRRGIKLIDGLGLVAGLPAVGVGVIKYSDGKVLRVDDEYFDRL